VDSLTRHIIVSPHLDDAALSLGGWIGALVARGAPVTVVTVFSAAETQTLSPLARELHRAWGAEANPIAVRQREDEQAMHLLGATRQYLHELDALYRFPDFQQAEDLFRRQAPEENLKARIKTALEPLTTSPHSAVQLYFPLGIGGHVDHRLVASLGFELSAEGVHPHFYEELPYALIKGSLATRQSECPIELYPTVLDVTHTFALRLDAIEKYSSQLEMLFASSDGMRQALTRYATGLCEAPSRRGERLWSTSERSQTDLQNSIGDLRLHL